MLATRGFTAICVLMAIAGMVAAVMVAEASRSGGYWRGNLTVDSCLDHSVKSLCAI
ncbi:hypothetical protein [Nitratireductor thuwali]|uniref:Uncharacterized protein n=1 Tax=Nitratireductor thuwali TaxID=2267699 RepID=A0ABY5MSY3_9HYPH|nr:hypothetical protein NTH_03442 [Nitratireductor thuwali]